MGTPVTSLVVFGPQPGPLQTGDLDTNFNLLKAAVNDATIGINFLIDSSVTVNLITVATPAGQVATLAAGLPIVVQLANTNTSGTVNLNLNGGGNHAVVDADGTTVGIGSLVTGMLVPMIYDGTAWRLSGPQATPNPGVSLLFADGTVTNPSISFANSPGAGFYLVGTNEIGFVTSGVQRGNIDANGGWSLNPAAAGATLTVNSPSGAAGYQQVSSFASFRINTSESTSGYQAAVGMDDTGLYLQTNSAIRTIRLLPNGAAGLAVSTSGVAITGRVGFNGATPLVKPTITGSRGANAALGSLISQMASYGLVTDGTTP